MKLIKFTTVNALREEIFRTPLEQFVLLQIGDRDVQLDPHAVHRLTEVASDIDATITYSYYRDRLPDGTTRLHPVIDYQPGSIRDDFDFGPVVLLNAADVLASTEDFTAEESAYLDGGWYALRLRVTMGRMLAMIPEPLYTVEQTDTRKSGEKQHDYVRPDNRAYQIEMEKVCTEHLRDIDALVSQNREQVDYDSEQIGRAHV